MMPGDSLRATLYHRFHRLLPLLAHPAARRAGRFLAWASVIFYFGFVALVLVLRLVVLPHIEDYRHDIARAASRALGQTVHIGRIEASWSGIHPDLILSDVRVADAEGRPALAFAKIEAILSWMTLPRMQLTLRLLRIDEPTLNLRRDARGQFFIAGMPLSQAESDTDLSDWILAQRRIRINGATLVWEDALRDAPALRLDAVNFSLDNEGTRHRFGLTALPPAGLASQIDLRGDFRGREIETPDAWSGQIFAQIDAADLAIWRQWVDYPVGLPQGRGALRAWLGFKRGAVSEITADVALEDVRLRLAREVPTLQLDHLSGRIGAKFSARGITVHGRDVALVTRASEKGGPAAVQAVRLAPTDFQAEWQHGRDDRRVTGRASASLLDLESLSSLAAYLPLDAATRRLLGQYSPRGRIRGLRLRWSGDADRLETYAIEAGVEALALKAQGYFPGFSGLSGVLEASEKGGRATLRSQRATLDLPSVFPESGIVFDTLNAQAEWKIHQGVLEAHLSRADFSGPEATGSAQGSYRTNGEGPGVIDMTAALTRADARAVWRYMPHAVNESTRHWLRDSLLVGTSSEAKLVLRGDLADFPFLDKRKGQFLVTAKAQDVVLDYANGWPRIEGIHGELRFEGNGMVVEAQRGKILGALLSKTRAEIPNFDAPVSTLLVSGQADGPTTEFLRFIAQSPVAARIDHFTEDLRATGNGHLDLSLHIPLDEARLKESRIEGTYRLLGNEVRLDAALPPMRQVSGRVQFSGSALQVPEMTASFLGGPLRIRGGTQKDGRVLILANGSVNVASLRKQSDAPWLAGLSGATPYRAEVRVNKGNADLLIESALAGLASSLPEPFAKTAAQTLPLRLEKHSLGGSGGREQMSASLGEVFSAQFIRRKQAAGPAIERGALAIGRPLELPEKGVTLGWTAKRLDLDAWRKWLPEAEGEAPLIDTLNLRTGDLGLLGRHFNDVDLSASLKPGQWNVRLNSRQAGGTLRWEGGNGGRLSARLKHLTLDSSPGARADTTEEARELPALDIIADDFSLGARRLGRLELQARNEGGLWHLERILASNPFGTLSGKGQWQTGGAKNRTQLEFKVESSDVGKWLERIGYPGAVRGGTATLGGKLGWNGSPADPDYPSLSGEVGLTVGKGQFLKIDPGAAGKLLGLISLQGLPRRITLDFKDVFSDGLAFDSIASKLSIRNGLMHTERLQIDGPSARVVMHGDIDLKRETQRLNVNVMPELGGTAALGVGLVNPAAGVATWLAHKVLQNPLNHVFGYEYLVTGTWDDPKVEKVSVLNPSATNSPAGAAHESARE